MAQAKENQHTDEVCEVEISTASVILIILVCLLAIMGVMFGWAWRIATYWKNRALASEFHLRDFKRKNGNKKK